MAIRPSRVSVYARDWSGWTSLSQPHEARSRRATRRYPALACVCATISLNSTGPDRAANISSAPRSQSALMVGATTRPARWLKTTPRTPAFSAAESESTAIIDDSSWLQPAFEEIPALDQRANLAVDDAALQHPEAAIGMDVPQAISHGLDDALDARRDQLRTLDLVVFDVDHANPEADPRIEVAEDFQLVISSAREFEHEMIGAQGIQERNQVSPEASQHRLAAVVAEADVNGPLVHDAVQDVIDRVRRPARVLRVPGNAGLVELHGVGFDELELSPEHRSHGHRELGQIRVKRVVHQPREHVRAGAGELEA